MFRFGLYLATSLALVAAAVAPSSARPRTSDGTSGRLSGAPAGIITTRIRHVVIIDQENRSFDNVLGTYCVEAGSGKVTRQACDGALTGVLPDGTIILLGRAPDMFTQHLDHSVKAQQTAINGGAMNGFGL